MNTMASSVPPASTGFRVDISRGERVGRVSSEWFSRPDDERYLSLGDLYDAVKSRTDRAHARTVESSSIRVEASRNNSERLELIIPAEKRPVTPTHWSYGQLCSLVGAPASYMRQLPAPLAGINLQHGLLNHRAELVKTLEADDGRLELRAITGPEYIDYLNGHLVSLPVHRSLSIGIAPDLVRKRLSAFDGFGAFNDIGDGILADAKITGDPAVTATFGDKRENFCRKPIGFGPLPGLPAKLFAARFRCCEPGLNPLADQVAFEFGDAGKEGCQHPAVRRGQVEGYSVRGDDRHVPARQRPQRVEEIDGRTAPSGKLCHQDGIDLSGLGERHDLFAFSTIKLRAGTRLFENSRHVVAGADSERCQVALLPLT